MKAWERERLLLERLQEQGSLALTEACALTGASVATTRRDFELLQEKGMAQRTHGGLQPPKKEEPKGYLQGTAILNHTDEEKYRIAQEALTNAQRHGAGAVSLTVDITGRDVIVEAVPIVMQ